MLIGGCVQSKSRKKEHKLVQSVNLRSGEIKTLKPMTTSRSYFAAVHFEGEVFAIGGEGDTYHSLSSVEK